MTSKGMSNYAGPGGSKSVGKTKVVTKVGVKEGPRHISLQKSSKREVMTKTQTGFYIIGDSIIPERLDEDQQSSQYVQPESYNNKIYNMKSPNSRANYRKQTNLNT